MTAQEPKIRFYCWLVVAIFYFIFDCAVSTTSAVYPLKEWARSATEYHINFMVYAVISV